MMEASDKDKITAGVKICGESHWLLLSLHLQRQIQGKQIKLVFRNCVL